MKFSNYLMSLLASAVLIGGVSACAYIQTDTPQQKLDAAKLTYTSVVAVYDGICVATPHPALCNDAKAQIAERSAKQLFADAFDAAQTAINVNGTLTPDQISTLINTVIDAVTVIENLEASLKEENESSSG
jgi:hypothetical protein